MNYWIRDSEHRAIWDSFKSLGDNCWWVPVEWALLFARFVQYRRYHFDQQLVGPHGMIFQVWSDDGPVVLKYE